MDMRKQAPDASAVSYHEFPYGPEDIIDRGNGEVLFDIGYGKEESGATTLKTAKDGHSVLIPQPSDDPDDPLNWSETRKNLLLLSVTVSTFLTDFQAAVGAALLVVQGQEWNMSPNHVVHSANLAVLMLGFGGCFWMPFIYFWGRAPVVFWTTVFGTLFTLGAALVQNFEGYYGLRGLMCFFIAAGQSTGLAFIQDTYFFHQHARKIGIWSTILLTCPYFGPMFGLFIVARTGSWRACFWMTFGLEILVLSLILLFVDETWYRRDIAPDAQPKRGNRVWRLLGIWQIRHHKGYFMTIWSSTKKLLQVTVKPVTLVILVFTLLSFMWVVGINQTAVILVSLPIEQGGYGFGPLASGYLYFAPIIGVLIGEAAGHWGNDWILRQYVRRHNGVFRPEARLWPIYPSGIIMAGGLILVGQALAHHLHWAVLGLGWATYIVGIMMMSVAVTTYLLDSYSAAPGEIAALLNLARTIGGFSVGYFQLDWGLKSGFDVSFGSQGGIAGGSVLIMVAVHIWGPKMRAYGGGLST